MLSAFLGEKVDFLIVGGIAMAFHGYVRGTGDIDFWIRISEENADRVWRAIKIFGAPTFDLERDDLLIKGTVYQIGVIPNRIDIINSIDGVEFDDAWAERKIALFEDLRIPTISKPLLLKNKITTGRPKDQIDALWIEKHPTTDTNLIDKDS